MQNALIQLDCLYKQLEMNDDLMKDYSRIQAPIANDILNDLHDIKGNLLLAKKQLEELQQDKANVALELINEQHENYRLWTEIKEMEQVANKKVTQLKEALDANKREALSLKHLNKSLKRERRRMISKKLYPTFK